MRKEFEKFMANREKEKEVRAQSPAIVSGLEPTENQTNEGATKPKKGPKKQPASKDNTPKAPRQSGRARKATDVPGGVAIDVLHATGKRKRAESPTIFDTIEENWDNEDDQIEKAQKQELEAVEKDSHSNAVIKAVLEAAKLEEKAGTEKGENKPDENDTGDKNKTPTAAEPENTDIPSMPVTLFEKEDLAVAGTEAKMRGRKHPETLSRKDSYGSHERLGRYELPGSMYMRPAGWGAQTFPAHIEKYYPKPRVPRHFIAIPNYTRILNETAALRRLQMAQPTRVTQQVFYWTENRIHEEDHARRLKDAIKAWGEERAAMGKEEVDLWEHDSEDDQQSD